MKRNLKMLLAAGSVVCMTLGSAVTSLAGTWRTGAKPNQSKWWYDYDNGTYAENGWQWIDGNKDGTAECYYFDKDGWMMADTRTPDGYTVNADGAWVENGAVQTRREENQNAQSQGQGTQSQAAHGTYFAGNYDASGNWVTDSQMMTSDYWTDFWGFLVTRNPDEISSLTTVQKIDLWAQNTARGAYWKAAFDAYGIPCEALLTQVDNFSGAGGSVTFTTTVGIPADALRDLEAVTQMLMDIRTDGMATCTFSTSQGAGGEAATVTVTYKMMG